ncbi:MAG TPA: hypothetical protein VIJ11_03115 [Galbitalea sp.]
MTQATSTNPLVDYHIIFALSLIVIAVLSAGDSWSSAVVNPIDRGSARRRLRRERPSVG